jgi:hypothetical protein
MDRYIKLHNVDFDDLIKTIDECKGDVYLETTDGDILNLKSKLCQYVSMASLFSNGDTIPELEIIAYEPADTQKLISFMMNGE